MGNNLQNNKKKKMIISSGFQIMPTEAGMKKKTIYLLMSNFQEVV